MSCRHSKNELDNPFLKSILNTVKKNWSRLELSSWQQEKPEFEAVHILITQTIHNSSNKIAHNTSL